MSSPYELRLQREKEQLLKEIECLPRPLITELAQTAMKELVEIVESEELWVRDGNLVMDLLSAEQYAQSFPDQSGSRPSGYRSEGSRDSSVVAANRSTLVQIFMDVNHWTTAFSGIVGRAMTLQVLSDGIPAESFNGTMQLMMAEIQLPSPLAPTRESLFVRYSKQGDSGTWAVVDVSLDHLLPNTTSRCRKRPSGCLITEVENGLSKVVWVEHVEVHDVDVHYLYETLVNTPLAFGAERWLASLERYCDRLENLMMCDIIGDGNVGGGPQNGRRSMLLLAQRMMNSYRAGVGASTYNNWDIVPASSGDSEERIMVNIRSVDNPIGNPVPPGTVLNVATSIWLPVSPKRLFDFLRDGNSRKEWDILCEGHGVQEVAYITYGPEPANRVSLFRTISTGPSTANKMLLQESSMDETGSFIVYAPVDGSTMINIVSGRDPDGVPILPSGFAILPYANEFVEGEIPKLEFDGSVLTVAFQILIHTTPAAQLTDESMESVKGLISSTVEKIKAAFEP